jgi:hypothetical protein
MSATGIPKIDRNAANLLDLAHQTFRRWLGDDYDIDTLNATLAAAAVERLDGDPLWLLVVSGPGNAKTETVQSLSGAGAMITSTIASEGALLSGTPKKGRAKGATGGLLRAIGAGGILVIKDVTSILSADRNVRGPMLAALREIYDGRWERNLGSDGGQTLTWTGRIVVVGAVTTAWDTAHGVVATMGDRFVLIRADSHKGRVVSGRRAINNVGSEVPMRKELSTVVGALIANVKPNKALKPTDAEVDHILRAADVVTLARTGVETDYRGDIIDGHAPEMPTRFAKQLTQILRGGFAIGMPRDDALSIALRCARDSMPPLRLAALLDVAKTPDSALIDIRRRLDKPRTTVDRVLQSLHVLGLVTCREVARQHAGKAQYSRLYSLAQGIDLGAIQ